MPSSNEINGVLVDVLFDVLAKKINIPTEFHNQASAISIMLDDDCTGLIDSLTDFMVESAEVKYDVKTDNETYNKILKKWLKETINSDYKGQVPRGINSLAEEYFKERWKGSSFPILKIAKWKKVKGINLPSKMFFVDGGSVWANSKSSSIETKIGNYNYYLGKDMKDKLDKGVIITKPYGRWFSMYPKTFLVKRGIYHNYTIINALKDKQAEVLNQVIPYILMLKRGTEALTQAALKGEGGRIWKDDEMKEIAQALKDEVESYFNTLKNKAFTRATQYDEKIEHLIPSLEPIFKASLTTAAEKGILGGFGFLDIAEAVASNRKESVLNPTAFIAEIKKGVKDFRERILTELIYRIKEENRGQHKKYGNLDFLVTSSPVQGFMTDKFKSLIRSFYDRGILSRETALEIGVEVPFESELKRIEKETKAKVPEKTYPPLTQNTEGKGKDLPDSAVPDDKINPAEKKNFKQAMLEFAKLEGSPYQTVKQLPESVKKLSITKQRKWMKIFNNAYHFYLSKFNEKKADALAAATAWSKIKK